jgi:DNA repair exonuclease SbcCD nuclease subunit
MSADLTIIGDIHLGVERVSHTTPVGRERLRQKIFDRAADIVRRADGYVVQAGDLFDKTRNDDKTLFQGYSIVSQVPVVLAGNHDVANRANGLSSLQMVDAMLPDGPVDLPDYNDPSPIFHDSYPATALFTCPYQPTQEAFVRALDSALVSGRESRSADRFDGIESVFVLVLHCNYDLTFAKDDPLTNNLSPEKAEELLEVFDYIFCGHEHNPRVLHNGRLIMTGSIMPLSFAEMTDKFIWRVENGKVTYELIWSVDRHYRCLDAVEAPDVLAAELEFIKVTGTVSASEYADLLRKVQTWWQESPNLLAVNISEVEVEGLVTSGGGDEIFKPMAVRPLAESMEALLQDSGLLELWRQIYAEMT